MWRIVKSLEDSTSKQEKSLNDERLKVMLEAEKKRETFPEFSKEASTS